MTKPERCRICYFLRLEKTVKFAKENQFEAFTTSLLVSPYQQHEDLKKIAFRVGNIYRIPFIYQDFRPFYRESVILSKELGMYRQKYCGCIFSEEERSKKRSGFGVRDSEKSKQNAERGPLYA